MRLLLIEDDRDLALMTERGLRKQGFEVDLAHDGIEGEVLARERPYDLLLIDWVLPRQDGKTLVARLRETGSRVPILMLTGLEGEEHVVAGLDAGADDYVTKPFSLMELTARLRALLRRAEAGAAGEEVEVGPLHLVSGERTVRLGTQPLELREKEYLLLALLARHAGSTVDRATIVEEVWGRGSAVSDMTVNTTVSTLRQKLAQGHEGPAGRVQIETVRGVGYMLVVGGS